MELNKNEGNTVEAVRLANEIVDIQTDKIENDDIGSLSKSVQLYEDAVKSYGDDGILNKNLDKLKPPQEELDISPEPDLENLGAVNFEDDDEITLSESFEDMPDLEMPFDDLMELADDEVFDRGEDEESLDNLVYVDAPIDDSPDIGVEYDPLELTKPGPNRNRKNDIPEEEFQLQDTSAREEMPATGAPAPQSQPYQAPPNEPAPYQAQPQQQSSVPESDYSQDLSSAAKSEKPDTADIPFSGAKPDAVDSFGSQGEEIEMGTELETVPEFQNASSPLPERPADKKTPQDSDRPSLDEMDLSAEDSLSNEDELNNENELIDDLPASSNVPLSKETNLSSDDEDFLDPAGTAPDSLIPSSFDDDLNTSDSVDEIVNKFSDKPYLSVLPHSLKESPQFEEELDIIESYEIVNLFVYLRDLMDNLPSIELKDFLISNERIQMEYVINKLSGEVGLKRRMILLNVKGALKKTIDPKTSTDKTLKDVLGYLRIIASQLPDKGFASACIGKINSLIEQIE